MGLDAAVLGEPPVDHRASPCGGGRRPIAVGAPYGGGQLAHEEGVERRIRRIRVEQAVIADRVSDRLEAGRGGVVGLEVGEAARPRVRVRGGDEYVRG